MPDKEKVIRAVDSCFEYWLDKNRYLHPLELETVRQLKADAIALLKERDYRGWLMDMFHKYGRDDLITLLVLHGEENLLADVLKEQETVVRCKYCAYKDEINCPQYYRRSELTDSYFCADGKLKND